MSFKMSLISKEMSKDRRWGVFVNGVALEDVDIVEIKHPKYGAIAYGQRPEDYPGLAFTPPGGVIILPYVIPVDGEFLVGLIKEDRPNMGEKPVWCGIGGYCNPGEMYHEAAIREFIEETGFNGEIQLEELLGLPMNSDRSLYVADPQKGEGVHTYCVRILDGELEADKDYFKFKDSVLFPDFKKVNEVRFFPWRKAVLLTADALALAALARLKATIG